MAICRCVKIGKIQSIKLVKTWDFKTKLPNKVAASQVWVMSTLNVVSPNWDKMFG